MKRKKKREERRRREAAEAYRLYWVSSAPRGREEGRKGKFSREEKRREREKGKERRRPVPIFLFTIQVHCGRSPGGGERRAYDKKEGKKEEKQTRQAHRQGFPALRRLGFDLHRQGRSRFAAHKGGEKA